MIVYSRVFILKFWNNVLKHLSLRVEELKKYPFGNSIFKKFLLK